MPTIPISHFPFPISQSLIPVFDPPITTTGTVLDSPKPKIYQVSLPNGKVLIGHVPKALIHLHESIKPNTRVNLELTPYDFEKGRIMGIVEES